MVAGRTDPKADIFLAHSRLISKEDRTSSCGAESTDDGAVLFETNSGVVVALKDEVYSALGVESV